MTDAVAADLINRRRDRAIAAILGVKEREADPHLPREAARILRKVVLDQLNDFASLVGDLLTAVAEAPGDGLVVNDLWLEQIAQIHEAIVGEGNGVACP